LISIAAERTALVRAIGFSNPTVTTRNGSPSDNSSILIGTPSFVVTRRPNRKAKEPEMSTEVASQTWDPRRLIDINRNTKVRCIDMYPSVMIAISIVSAC
jgi:hypothetical protein